MRRPQMLKRSMQRKTRSPCAIKFPMKSCACAALLSNIRRPSRLRSWNIRLLSQDYRLRRSGWIQATPPFTTLKMRAYKRRNDLIHCKMLISTWRKPVSDCCAQPEIWQAGSESRNKCPDSTPLGGSYGLWVHQIPHRVQIDCEVE